MAVRAYVPPSEEEKVSSSTFNPPDDAGHGPFDRIIVFDTETTTDRLQNLKFGSFKIYEHNTLRYQGVFYHPEHVSKKELLVLADYCKEKNIKLMTVEEFVDNVFLPEVYDLKTLCVGFNLPFDLSRLARSFGFSRGKMKGGFSFTLSENKKYPQLRIKHIDGTKAFIQFASSIDKNKRKSSFRGNFLDLHTLAFSLTGEKHSLQSACKLFGTEFSKTAIERHGKITTQYIDYNIRDVDASYSLYLKLKEEFELFGLHNIPITKLYSPASIGKECLRMMGIRPFLAKNNNGGCHIDNETLGYVATTYYGGRSEVKVRKTPVTVTLLDFTSMYPTMCILMNLWDFITCDHIEQQQQQDCTGEVTEFVESIKLEDLQEKETWSRLNAIVQVDADDNDILPIRAKFGNKQTFTIGLPYVDTTKLATKPWYTLADIVSSKLLTGKTPKILRAIKFFPVGKQKDMQPINIFSADRKIDPYRENFFKAVIEERKKVQQLQEKKSNDEHEKIFLDKKQKALKLIANSTSYGIFMEINAREHEAKEITVYGLEKINCRVKKIEEFGKQVNPLVATFITSGARLVLAIVEAILKRHSATHTFCDTDSMAVPPQYKKEIQDFFGKLNPYDFDATLFKVEHENIWFYGISAKRYALYSLTEKNGQKQIEIVKASSHGLGQFLSPFEKKIKTKKKNEIVVDWYKEIWLDIVKLHYGMISKEEEELYEKYNDSYALAQLTISTPSIMKRFERINKGKPYDCQIKPFNFCIVGVGNDVDEQTGKPIKPLSPYRKNAQECPYDSFIDYTNGGQLKGLQYWRPFNDVLRQYISHPESKFDGDVGVLARKHVAIKSAIHIGKESNNLEQAEVLGVQEEDDCVVVYDNNSLLLQKRLFSHKEMILQLLEPKDVKEFGISRQTLNNVKHALASGDISTLKSKTVKHFLAFISKRRLDGGGA